MHSAFRLAACIYSFAIGFLMKNIALPAFYTSEFRVRTFLDDDDDCTAWVHYTETFVRFYQNVIRYKMRWRVMSLIEKQILIHFIK